MHYIAVACRLLIALVFLVSATSKLRSRTDLQAFADSLPHFLPVLSRWVGPLAPVIALGELMVVPLVLLPSTAPVGSALAFALLAGFTVGIAVLLRRGQQVTCRCFGPAREPLGRRHLVRNGLLMVAALGGMASGAGPTHPGGLVLAAASGLVTGLVLIHFDDIVALFMGPAANRNQSR